MHMKVWEEYFYYIFAKRVFETVKVVEAEYVVGKHYIFVVELLQLNHKKKCFTLE